MRAAVRLGQVVQFEGMRHRPLRQSGRGRMNRFGAAAQDLALAAGAVGSDVFDDHLAPRQFGAVNDNGNCIGNAVTRALQHFRRHIGITQLCTVSGQAHGLATFGVHVLRILTDSFFIFLAAFTLFSGTRRRRQQYRCRASQHAGLDKISATQHAAFIVFQGRLLIFLILERRSYTMHTIYI